MQDEFGLVIIDHGADDNAFGNIKADAPRGKLINSIAFEQVRGH